jgi:hypothetical protein
VMKRKCLFILLQNPVHVCSYWLVCKSVFGCIQSQKLHYSLLACVSAYPKNLR